MANVNPPFTGNQDLLFSPEQLNPASNNSQSFYRDAYKQYLPPVTSDSNEVAQGILPNIIVNGDNAESLERNWTVERTPGNGGDKTTVTDEITVDNVFRHPITNEPAIVDRAAKAMARDIERMIVYMAVMQVNSQQLMKVKDVPTVSALQTAIGTEMTNVQQRVTRRLQEIGVNEETAQGIFELLATMRTKLSNGGNQQSDQTFPAV